MNEKLKQWEGRISYLLPKDIARNRTSSDALVCFSVSGETKSDKRSVLRVSFHKRLFELTGWQIGDILDMEVKENQAAIFRSDKGRKICKGSPEGTRHYVRYALAAGGFVGFPCGEGREPETAPGKLVVLLPQA